MIDTFLPKQRDPNGHGIRSFSNFSLFYWFAVEACRNEQCVVFTPPKVESRPASPSKKVIKPDPNYRPLDLDDDEDDPDDDNEDEVFVVNKHVKAEVKVRLRPKPERKMVQFSSGTTLNQSPTVITISDDSSGPKSRSLLRRHTSFHCQLSPEPSRKPLSKEPVSRTQSQSLILTPPNPSTSLTPVSSSLYQHSFTTPPGVVPNVYTSSFHGSSNTNELKAKSKEMSIQFGQLSRSEQPARASASASATVAPAFHVGSAERRDQRHQNWNNVTRHPSNRSAAVPVPPFHHRHSLNSLPHFPLVSHYSQSLSQFNPSLTHDVNPFMLNDSTTPLMVSGLTRAARKASLPNSNAMKAVARTNSRAVMVMRRQLPRLPEYPALPMTQMDKFVSEC